MIIIDGDACPSIKLIVSVAKLYNKKVKIYVDDSHLLESDYATIIVVSTSNQSVDMRILNEIENGDILITSDYGLASLALSKATVISPKGQVYTDFNIDILLNQRYMNSKLRKQSIKTINPKKRTIEDDLNLEKCLKNILEQS